MNGISEKSLEEKLIKQDLENMSEGHIENKIIISSPTLFNNKFSSFSRKQSHPMRISSNSESSSPGGGGDAYIFSYQYNHPQSLSHSDSPKRIPPPRREMKADRQRIEEDCFEKFISLHEDFFSFYCKLPMFLFQIVVKITIVFLIFGFNLFLILKGFYEQTAILLLTFIFGPIFLFTSFLQRKAYFKYCSKEGNVPNLFSVPVNILHLIGALIFNISNILQLVDEFSKFTMDSRFPNYLTFLVILRLVGVCLIIFLDQINLTLLGMILGLISILGILSILLPVMGVVYLVMGMFYLITCNFCIRKRIISFNKSKDGNGSCSICLIQFKEREKLLKLSCKQGHFFHGECILEWLSQNTTCPICKAEVEINYQIS